MEPHPNGLVRRRLEAVATERMEESPVVLLQGPRAVGKSTLLRALADRSGSRVVDLDDPAVCAAVEDDPGVFVAGDGPVFIDEYQRVPPLLDAIKSELNRSSRPGRFVLAGSTRFDALPVASQALTGRLHRLEIHPLAQCELGGRREGLIPALLADPAAVLGPPQPASETTRTDYAHRVVRGGFPMALARSERARDRWFDDYLALSLERDLLDAARVRRPAALAPLLARLAAQSAQVLNMSKAAEGVGLPASTATDYVRLFESGFLVRLLPGWGTTLRAGSAVRPKVYMADSGLAARLLRLSARKLAGLDAASLQQFGHLLETFVVGEVLAQASWMDYRPHVGHWRTYDGAEVDLVLEDGESGAVLAIEVKASTRVHERDRRGLRALRERLGERFRAGVVFHTGAYGVGYRDPADDRILALPIDWLWR